MGFYVFLGVFLAVLVGIAALVLYFRRKLRSFSSRVFGSADMVNVLKEADVIDYEEPRSLNGCDRMLLPQILQDFPDFDVNLAKTYARDFLKKKNQGRLEFRIHNVVIAKYLKSGAQRTIVFQAAACHRENGRLRQQRFDLYYTYLLPSGDSSAAANCPNCGGALGYGVTQCPYCDSRVANVLGNTWEFTEVRET